MAFNWRTLDEHKRKGALSWTATNLIWFVAGTYAIPDFQPKPELHTYFLSILIAVLSSLTSIAITWNMYFSADRSLDIYLGKPLTT